MDTPNLIVMLTYRDQTVADAIEIFESCRHLPVDCWGFKNIGLPVPKMQELVAMMKDAGKTTFMEVVTYREEECRQAAELAVACKFDYLMGTIYYETVHEAIKRKPIKYMPFCGKISGNPSIMEGTIPGIIAEARRLERQGVHGFDLLAYRYTGDPDALAQQFTAEIKSPVVIAGSIDSYARIDRMKELHTWGFTIGGAFFEKRFVADGTFAEQVEAVRKYLDVFKTHDLYD